MSPRELMQVSDLQILPTRSQVQSASASYHVALIGAKVLNKWKMIQMRRANRLFLAGLGFFLISFVGNMWTASPRRQGLDVKFELKTGWVPPRTGGDPL